MEIEELREDVRAWTETVLYFCDANEIAEIDEVRDALLAALDDAWKWRTWSEEPSIEREARRYREALQAHHAAATYSTGLVEVGEVCPVCGIACEAFRTGP